MILQELTVALSAHRPSDAREFRHHEALIQLISKGESCLSRDHYVPGHVTVSAFVVDPTRTRLALIFHKKLGRWLQPGGHLEPSDPGLEAAARREVTEETGLAALRALGGIFDVDVHDIPARPSEPAHSHFDVRFAFEASSDEARPSETEVGGFRWVPLDDLGRDPSLETDESVLRAARKLGELLR